MLPRNEAQKEIRFLNAREVGQIINHAKEPYATMFAVLGMTGCRVGEMLGLKLGEKVIYIRRSIDSRTNLNKEYRDNPSRYLFANRNAGPYSVGKVTEYGLWPVRDKLGIPRTGTHAFRHAAAS